jgi:hypothetical protein
MFRVSSDLALDLPAALEASCIVSLVELTMVFPQQVCVESRNASVRDRQHTRRSTHHVLHCSIQGDGTVRAR